MKRPFGINSSEWKTFWKCFYYAMDFEVALFAAVKTTRTETGFGIFFNRQKTGQNLGGRVWGLSLYPRARVWGVLNTWAAAGNAAKTRGSAISEGRSPRKEDIAKPNENTRTTPDCGAGGKGQVRRARCSRTAHRKFRGRRGRRTDSTRRHRRGK